MLALQTCFEVCQTRHPRNLWKCDWRSLFLEPGNLKSVIVSRYTWNNNRTLAKSRKIKSLHRILWHCTKKFSIIDFFSKCDQICRKLQIWSHFLKKPLMGNFIFFFCSERFARRIQKHFLDNRGKSWNFSKIISLR